MNFKDKVVVITGAGGGIGRATALLFAQNGAKIVANALKPDNKQSAPETVKLIENKGGEAIYIEGDVSNPESAQSIINKTVETYGRTDVLVSIAGIVIPGN